VRLSAVMERPLRTEIGRTMVKAAEEYRKDEVISPAFAGHKERVERIITPVLETTLNTFHERFNNIKGMSFEKKSVDLWRLAVNRFFAGLVADNVTKIVSTTEVQVRAAITRGLEDGAGVAMIADDIVRVAPQISGVRAHVIARTETHMAANYANVESAKAAQVDMLKEWISDNSERTRGFDRNDEFDHFNADTQTVGLNEAFKVSGEDLQYPGDPVGSAGNIINCRCAVGYVLP
jgi:hypothetical protein